MKNKGSKNLTYVQRLELEACIKAGLHKKVIAEKLGVCLATVYNELKRGECIRTKKKNSFWYGNKVKQIKIYDPKIAEANYRYNSTAKGAPLKLANDYEFVQYVEKRVLKDKLSPCAVLGEIKRKNIKFATSISKTTLYRYIANGIFMNITMVDLPYCQRKKHYRKVKQKRLSRGTSIELRPDIVSERKTFGHWEMDSVVGKQRAHEVLLVLSERLTRYEIIMKMPNRKAESVVACLNHLEEKFGDKFSNLFKTITVDNGFEFSDFNGLERSINGGKRTNVYYCHPYSSFERGTNERINRDIRRWLPKGYNFSNLSIKKIKAIENWVNSYPREIFGFATSGEMFAKEFAKI